MVGARNPRPDIGRRWLASRRVDPSTQIKYEIAWRLPVEPTFGRRSVAAIKPGDIQGWLARLGESYGTATLATAYVVLYGIMELAIADGQRRDNPARSEIVTKPSARATPEKAQAWPDAVVWSIIDAHPAQLRLLPVLMAGCGIRIGEGLALDEADFDWDRHILHVRRQLKKLGKHHVFALPKNDRERDVPMADWVKIVARQHFATTATRPVTLPWEKPGRTLLTVQLSFRSISDRFVPYRGYRRRDVEAGARACRCHTAADAEGSV